MTAQGAVVRLRWLRGMVTTRVMPVREATRMADDLLHDVIDCGAGNAFVTMTGWDGRTANIRGRDVITVECVPDIADRAHEPRVGEDQPTRAQTVGGVQVHASGGTVGSEAAAGTAFLRQVASHEDHRR